MDSIPYGELTVVYNLLRAVTNRTRISILELIDKHTNLCVVDLVVLTGLEQSAVSQHLKILKQKDIVVSKRHKKFVIYSINYPKIEHILNAVLESNKLVS